MTKFGKLLSIDSKLAIYTNCNRWWDMGLLQIYSKKSMRKCRKRKI